MEIITYGNDVFKYGILGSLIYSVVILFASYILLKIIDRSFAKIMGKDQVKSKTALGFVKNVLRVIIKVFTAFLIITQINAFKSLGTALLGASSVLAVVIGFAAQESMGNFIGGFFLSFYEPFKVGDYIKLPANNISGEVVEVGFRHTIIKTLANSRVIIPNNVMNNAIVENTNTQLDTYNQFLTFGISYDSDVNLAISLIQDIVKKHPNFIDIRSYEDIQLNKPEVNVILRNLNDSSVDLRCTLSAKDLSSAFAMSCDIRKEVKEAFDQNGIVIPFPSRTIYQNN